MALPDSTRDVVRQSRREEGCGRGRVCQRLMLHVQSGAQMIHLVHRVLLWQLVYVRGDHILDKPLPFRLELHGDAIHSAPTLNLQYPSSRLTPTNTPATLSPRATLSIF